MLEGPQVATKLRLADVRAELRLSQEALAAASDISRQVVANAERGLAISRISAHAIIFGLNKNRALRNMPTLTIDDIDWKIRGEK